MKILHGRFTVQACLERGPRMAFGEDGPEPAQAISAARLDMRAELRWNLRHSASVIGCDGLVDVLYKSPLRKRQAHISRQHTAMVVADES